MICWASCAAWKAGELTTRVFRHTWTAARLQTLDRGAPLSVYTVARELGHGSEEMVRRVYAHLGTVRHRSEVVEYRIEQHLEALKDRLGSVGFVTRNVTCERAGVENETPASIEIQAGKTFRSGPGPTRMRHPLLRRQVQQPRCKDLCAQCVQTYHTSAELIRTHQIIFSAK